MVHCIACNDEEQRGGEDPLLDYKREGAEVK